MTERLYERDSYLNSFEAKVLSCEQAEDGFFVVLDKTAFFPEGGGQAADKGTLGSATVLDVQQKGDTIVHKTDTPFEIGATVKGELDWSTRYNRMQSHTGEHILSGVVHALFGYDNVGFHMGEEFMTVDFSGPLTAADIEKIELESNKSVYKNADITVLYPTAEELSSIDYRSKLDITENVRIVKIGDTDCCACCAPHLAKTGEVGVIKVIDSYPNKQGTRVEMIAGESALLDYARLCRDNKKLMGLLKAPRNGVLDAVLKLSEDYKTLRAEYQNAARKLAFYELEKETVGENLLAFSSGASFDELRYCSNLLTPEYKLCALFSKAEDGFMYVISSQSEDVREIVKSLNENFGGKGGGKSDYAQGKLTLGSAEQLRTHILSLLNK